MTQLSDLQNIHAGKTIYVFGSGATLDYLNPRFFDDQICVATNFVGGVFGLKSYYTFSHYEADSRIVCQEEGSVLVVCPRSQNLGTCFWNDEAPEGVVLFDTDCSPPGCNFNPVGLSWPLENTLVIGASSLHGSMHLAAYMGAKFIVLVGADCGQLAGKDRVEGYVAGDTYWGLYEMQLRLMKIKLKQAYDCDVHSLNPFVNYSLEGVQYRGAANIN
jgi:hypothetical protein